MSATLDNFCPVDFERPKHGLPGNGITVERRFTGRRQSKSIEGRRGV